MGTTQSSTEEEYETFSELDAAETGDEDLMPRDEEAELEILNDFVESLIDVAPPTWPPMA